MKITLLVVSAPTPVRVLGIFLATKKLPNCKMPLRRVESINIFLEKELYPLRGRNLPHIPNWIKVKNSSFFCFATKKGIILKLRT